MTYKWRISDVDALDMPMLFCLLDQMNELPPADFMAAAELKAARERHEREKLSALSNFKTEKGPVRRRKNGD